MRDFFEGIQSFFEDFAFQPLDYLRNLELDSWWLANAANWLFIIIGFAAFFYWMKQLSSFENEDDYDYSAR